MRRRTFLSKKPSFDQDLILTYIREHPGLSTVQITKGINTEFGFGKTLPEVFVLINLLKRHKKISFDKDPKSGEMVFNAKK
jgi:hypothetical protein